MVRDHTGALRVGPAGYAILTYVLAYALFVLSGPGSLSSRPFWLDLGQLALPAVGVALCFRTAGLVTVRRERSAWLLLSLACIALLLGYLAALLQEVALKTSPVSSPWFVLPWVFFYAFAFAGLILYLPRKRKGLAALAAALDGMIVTGAVLALIWDPIVRPAAFGTEGSGGGSAHIVWIAAGLLLFFGVASNFLRWPLKRVPVCICLLIGALALQVAADGAYSLLELVGEYRVGNTIDLVWPLSAGLLCFAALARVQAGGRLGGSGLSAHTLDLQWVEPIRLALPYVALPVAVVAVYQGRAEQGAGVGESGVMLLLVAAGLVALVMVRQVVSLVESRRLGRSLAHMSEDLEARVRSRTEELSARTGQLAALNRVATELSHCLSLAEVLSTGLKLASETVGTQVGVIWLCKGSGDLELVAKLGLPADGNTRIARLPDRVRAVQEAMRCGRPVVIEDYALLAYLPAGSATAMPHIRMLAVPLLSRDAVLGLMGLFGGEGIPDDEQDLAEAIGAQVGVAVDNVRRYEEAVDLADRDALTGLLNHRALYARLDQELRRAGRSSQDCSILMMDLDDFKALNDTHGHQAGDEVLKEVAVVLQEAVRTSDVIGRYGGDEFLAILPDTDVVSARTLAERLIEAFIGQFARPPGPAHGLGISVGVATSPADGHVGTQLIAVADANMYISKQLGGCRVTAGEGRARAPLVGLAG
jgi:diguanylate cyclase (GGDEF)-like protein